MGKKLILLFGLYLIAWNISLVESYFQSGNDCFEKFDYERGKINYGAQKQLVGTATNMDTKIELTSSLFSTKFILSANS